MTEIGVLRVKVRVASGKLAQAAGALTGDDLNFRSHPCSVMELSGLLAKLSEATQEYNSLIIEEMNLTLKS